MIDRTILHGHVFCGIGAGAEGFNQGEARVGNLVGKFECVGGIDVDPAACRDFTRRIGVPATCLDLFTREQYTAFHGREPPRGWREAVPDDIRRAFGYRRPHIVFLSAPCKGFSGLLSESTSRTAKYQALNGLTLRGEWIVLEAFKDDPVELILFENVPRIATRGRYLLEQIISLDRAYGYVVSESKHDCGELGHMAQSRKRFLKVARHAVKVPNYLYEPIRRPLRGVGEVIGDLPIPFPGSEQWNPMHRMPSLNWKTWVRLAFVEAGSDWRSLNKLRVEDGMLADFGILPDAGWHGGVLGVQAWGEHAGTVTSRSGPTNGAHAIADPRIDGHAKSVQLGVRPWDQAAGVVTGKMFVGGGPNAVADPRLGVVDGADFHAFRTARWGQSVGAITAARSPGGSAVSIADPRVAGKPRFNSAYRIVRWGETSPAVAGPGGPAGGLAVADPRYNNWHPGASSAKLRVSDWRHKTYTVTGAQQVGSGALSVADPRLNGRSPNGQLGMRPWGGSAGVIAGESFPTNGAFAVADPRAGAGAGFGGKGKYRVAAFGEHAGTVISASTTGQGAFGVADPRPDCLRPDREAYLTGGHYGVVQWEHWCGAIPGFAKNNNGPWSVGDPRLSPYATLDESEELAALPAADDRLVAIIQALDGTWHRPFTTLELAALQGLFNPGDEIERAAWGVDGRNFVSAGEAFALDGKSDSAWRERIGNAVPPPSAKAIAGVMGRTLLLAWSGETSGMATEPIWVRPIVGALMAAQVAP